MSGLKSAPGRLRTGLVLAVVLGAWTTMVPGLPASADTAPPAVGGTTAPSTVSSDVLPTVQVDGVVWTQTVVGNTVYAGGQFSTARPAGAPVGTSTTPRADMLAYDIRTGQLLTSFAPTFNGQVLGITPSADGTALYVVGNFTKVNGVNRYRVVKLDAATGAVLTGFNAVLDYRAQVAVLSGDVLYVGGAFSTANGQPRKHLAAFRAGDGALLSWAPSADDGQVMSMVASADSSRLVVGGQFTTLNGQAAYGLGALDTVSGATQPFPAASVVRDAGPNAAINHLSTDGQLIYGTGQVFGSGGNLEGTFAADARTGALAWLEDCHGDTYGAEPISGAVYVVGHAHFCGNIGGFPQPPNWLYHRALAFSTAATGTVGANTTGNYASFAGQPSPSLLTWWPDLAPGTVTGQNQAAWSVAGNSQYVVLGGEFPSVNGTAQQGLVRFAVRSLAPNQDGPQLKGSAFAPTLTALPNGSVRVSWAADWDRDNTRLSYKVVRNGDLAHPVATLQADSTFWNTPALNYVDHDVVAGTSYTYRLYATDPLGNTVAGDTRAVTARATSVQTGGYASRVMDDGATSYWRLDETGGPTVADLVGSLDATAGTGVTRGTAGAPIGDNDTASTFSGAAAGFASTRTAVTAPDSLSIEAWVRTTSTRGGRIVGFGNSATGSSTNYDRHLYLTNDGRVVFGVYPGAVKTLSSTAGYNDGSWHHVVATLGGTGMTLSVDGKQVASDPVVVSGQSYQGYWRIGGDSLGGWPARPSSDYLAGDIDEVAIYPAPLNPAQIAAHYAAGTGQVNAVPKGAFTAGTAVLDLDVDASGSTDPDGAVTGYAWSFGDGGTATGVRASHHYAVAGTYQVSLTVTDDAGASSTSTQPVTVSAPVNQAPTAAFTASTTGLAAGLDASASADPDGTVTGYDWSFGDGGTGTGQTVTHTYTQAGSYPITLTVTDDAGATATRTSTITVTAPATPAPLAADTFSRTVSNGLGSADTGGAWARSGSASWFSVGAGTARIVMAAPGAGPAAWLPATSGTDADLRFDVALDKVPSGGGAYLSALGRRVEGVGDYRLKVQVASDGALSATLIALSGGTQSTLARATVPGGAYPAGGVLHLRVQVSGTSPTTVAGKVWRDGDNEPSGWLLKAGDSTAALQAPGALGLIAYLSGSAGNQPVTATVDHLSAGASTP